MFQYVIFEEDIVKKISTNSFVVEKKQGCLR